MSLTWGLPWFFYTVSDKSWASFSFDRDRKWCPALILCWSFWVAWSVQVISNACNSDAKSKLIKGILGAACLQQVDTLARAPLHDTHNHILYGTMVCCDCCMVWCMSLTDWCISLPFWVLCLVSRHPWHPGMESLAGPTLLTVDVL